MIPFQMIDSLFDVAAGPLPVPMHASDGTALPLVKNGAFGADLIRFAPGTGVALHTHEGDHILLTISGAGRVIVHDEKNVLTEPLTPGRLYLIRGEQPHAIEADTELTLLAVGNKHRDAGSPERLFLVSELGDRFGA